METLFHLFGAPVTAYGAGMALALLATLILCGAYLRLRGDKAQRALYLAVAGIPLSWLMSRIVFVVANITYYTVTLSNPSLALRFWDGGYSLTGAVMGLLLAAAVLTRVMKLPRGLFADAVGFAAPVGVIIARLFEPGTGMGLGRPISYDWLLFLGVDDGMGDVVYPIFYIEAAVAAMIFLVLVAWTLRKRGAIRSGDTALVSMTLLGACQIVLESMRNDGHMVVHFIRIQMVLSLVALLVGLIVFSRRLILRGGMKKSQQLVLWLVTIACIGLAVFMEFRVDRGSNKLLYYAVMAACVAVITTMALKCRSKAESLAK